MARRAAPGGMRGAQRYVRPMGMTQHSSGTPDPTGGTGAPPTPFAPVPDSRPVDAPWPEMAWPPGGRRGPARAGRRARPGRPGPRRRRAVRGAGPRRRMATRGRPAAGRRRPGPPPGAVARGGAAPLGGAPRRSVAGLPAGTVVGTSTYLDVSVADARLEIGSTGLQRPPSGAARSTPRPSSCCSAYAFEVAGCRGGSSSRPMSATTARSRRSPRPAPHYEGTLRRYQRRARRHRARHRDVRAAGRGLAGGAGRPAGAPRRGERLRVTGRQSCSRPVTTAMRRPVSARR